MQNMSAYDTKAWENIQREKSKPTGRQRVRNAVPSTVKDTASKATSSALTVVLSTRRIQPPSLFTRGQRCYGSGWWLEFNSRYNSSVRGRDSATLSCPGATRLSNTAHTSPPPVAEGARTPPSCRKSAD